MDKEVQKTPSEDATTIAGRVLARGNPLDDQEIVDRLLDRMDPSGKVDRQAPTVVGMIEAIKEVLHPYFVDASSLAGAVLRLDPEAGQDGDS